MNREVAITGCVVGAVAFGIGYLVRKFTSQEYINTKREEQLLNEINDPSVKKAWAILRSEREELLNQLVESDVKAKKVISEIRNEREELLSQLQDKQDRWTLTYFDSRGRGEPIRLLFAEGGVNFTDKRIAGEEWPALKPHTPMGCLPVLEHNGKSIGESLAQVVYLAKLTDRWPRKPDAEAVALMVISGTEDIKREFVPAIFASEEEKPAKIEKLLKYLEEKLPYFEKLLENGFFTSGRLTAADIVFWDTLDQIVTFCPGPRAGEILNRFPNVVSWKRRVAELPNIARYLEKRK